MFILDYINKAVFTFVFLIRLENDEIASSKHSHLFLIKNDFSVQFCYYTIISSKIFLHPDSPESSSVMAVALEYLRCSVHSKHQAFIAT